MSNQDYITSNSLISVPDKRVVYESLIRLFSVLEFQTKKRDKIITPDETVMLSFFMEDGVTEKARRRAKEYFQKGDSKVHELTYRLVQGGYLISDGVYTRDKTISKTLFDWKNKYDESVRTGKSFGLAIKIEERAHAKASIKVSKAN